MAPWQEWVGRSTTTVAELDPQQANRMAVTLDRAPTFAEGDPLPHAWHWLYFHDLVPAARLGEDGHPALGVTMPPVPLPRRMWAGGELGFSSPLRLGATARRVSRIAEITPKQGRSGELYFVSVDSEITCSGGGRVTERQTIVYREAGPAATGDSPRSPLASPQFASVWEFTSTTLFRYSALTFNGHRIHYDADYAREVEGYAGLVVHGPLIATLLLDAAAGAGHNVERFSYRARSPLVLPERLAVGGRAEGASGELWARAEDSGRPVMEAKIRLTGVGG